MMNIGQWKWLFHLKPYDIRSGKVIIPGTLIFAGITCC
jgi:hypothetical protein